MRNIDIELLIKQTERQFEVDLKSKSRKRKEVYLRAILMKIIYKRTNLSLEKIGAFFNRDHATVIHNINLYDIVCNYPDFMELKSQISVYKKLESSFCAPCIIDSRNLLFKNYDTETL